MDLKAYYTKVRLTAATYTEKDVVIVSLATGDGGKAGVYTEVPKDVAATMVVEGTAQVVSAEQAAAFRQAHANEKQRLEREREAMRVPMTVITTADLNRLIQPQKQE